MSFIQSSVELSLSDLLEKFHVDSISSNKPYTIAIPNYFICGSVKAIGL